MFYQSELTKKAFDIVTKEFDGVKDKGGKPYIGHLMCVANGVPLGSSEVVEKLTAVGLLHDLIEDTKWTEEDLRKEFPDDVVDAVVALTKVDGENYEQYVQRVMTNELAIRVKISDLKDNMDVTRLPELGEYEIKRLKKYHMTYNILSKMI